MSGARLSVELIARTPLSTRVHRLRFVASAPFRWAAGQYLVVTFGRRQRLFLPYSIASAHDPRTPGQFELAVSIGSGADVMDTLPLGANLDVEAPLGDFTWQPTPNPAALLVGVGTGVVPLRALVEEELGRDSGARLLLLAGHRATEDLLFADDFSEFARRNPRFRYIPTLSAGGAEWAGVRGRVQALLVEAVSALEPLDAYVCGRLDMVGEVVSILQAHGVPAIRIRSEGF